MEEKCKRRCNLERIRKEIARNDIEMVCDGGDFRNA